MTTSEPGIASPLSPGRYLGVVVGGSLSKGLDVRLASETSIEEVKIGTYVTIAGERDRFFGMITDLALETSDPQLRASPPDPTDPFLSGVVSGSVAYGTLSVLAQLILPRVAGDSTGGLQPAKTIPAHFARVYAASEADIGSVFGQEDQRHFWIGTPLDMEAKVCLNVDELVKRSNGVFGKSGTGKSFLTRFLIIGMLQKTDATTLVFDMHNEYGWAGRDPERRRQVKGLKQLFPSRVAVFSLDEASSLRRGIHPDGLVNIGYKQIEPEDVALLAETWRLTPLAIDAAYRLHRRWGAEWLEKFLALRNENLVEEARSLGENFQTVSSLHRSLSSLSRFPFVTSSVTEDSVRRIMEYLERGTHVVLEFGKFQHDLDAYILVANILTRRIEEKYFERREESMGSGGKGPRPLVIVIEEAHKFLNPGVASQTTFGTIAREMRKSNVTLLVIDQRPSGIDPEIMSQLGSKVACLLDNEQDVDAVLAGVSGRNELRGVLARLESTQQALIFGHAVPMPVVVRVREYGSEASYAELGRVPAARRPDRDRDGEDELFG